MYSGCPLRMFPGKAFLKGGGANQEICHPSPPSIYKTAARLTRSAPLLPGSPVPRPAPPVHLHWRDASEREMRLFLTFSGGCLQYNVHIPYLAQKGFGGLLCPSLPPHFTTDLPTPVHPCGSPLAPLATVSAFHLVPSPRCCAFCQSDS